MRLTQAIDQYLADMAAEGRINSAHTELAYRTKLPQRRRTSDRVQAKTERLNLGRRLDEELDHLIEATPGVQVGIRCHAGDHEGCSAGNWCECSCHQSDGPAMGP